MKNKKGFISMTLVYSFLTLFLFIMAAIMLSQTEKSNYLSYINEKVNDDMEGFKGKNLTLMKRMLEDNTVTDGTMFTIGQIANNSIGNGNGLYYIDGGTGDDLITDENNDKIASRIYFYRGQVSNNNVIISKVTATETTNYCFRIIRTNEDGNIRMMFMGTTSNNQCNVLTSGLSSKYDEYDNDNAFVGYMHGKAEEKLIGGDKVFHRRIEDNPPVLADDEEMEDVVHSEYQDTHYFYTHDLDIVSSGGQDILKYFFKHNYTLEYNEKNSEAKMAIDTWYADNLLPVSSLIADTMFCVDRKVEDPETTGYSNINTTYYDTSKTTHLFTCPQAGDRLSLSIYNGGTNSAINSLEYPVGLPTATDIIYAGGSFSEANSSFYLYTGEDYWTLTPYSFNSTAKVTYVTSGGRLSNANATSSKSLHPVISVRPDVVVKSGNGTKNSPYIIVASAVTNP